jgi:hypothetical protein
VICELNVPTTSHGFSACSAMTLSRFLHLPIYSAYSQDHMISNIACLSQLFNYFFHILIVVVIDFFKIRLIIYLIQNINSNM